MRGRFRYGRWLIVLFLAAACLSPTAALASNKAIEVPCRVEPNTVSLLITPPGTVDYGTVELDTVALGQTQTVQNNSTASETVNFRIKSSHATGETGWSLGASRGINTFTHEASIDGFTTPIAMLVVDTYYILATGIGTGSSQTFDLRIGMPTEITDYTEKTIIVTIQAVAP